MLLYQKSLYYDISFDMPLPGSSNSPSECIFTLHNKEIIIIFSAKV